MPLLQAFGQHTEAANWVLNYLLNKVQHNIKSPLYVDVSLVEDTIGLLMSLVDIRHKYVKLIYFTFVIILHLYECLKVFYTFMNQLCIN